MDGLSRILGIGPTIVVEGQRFPTYTLRLKHYAQAEAEIVHLRGDPFDYVREAISCFQSDSAADQFAKQAISHIDSSWRGASFEEIAAWYETEQGRRFLLWQCTGQPWEWVQGVSVDWDAVFAALQQSTEFTELAALESITLSAIHNRAEGGKSSWSYAIRSICEVYTGLTYLDVSEMTLGQFAVLCADRKKASDGLKELPHAVIIDTIKQRDEIIRRASINLRRGRLWNERVENGDWREEL